MTARVAGGKKVQNLQKQAPYVKRLLNNRFSYCNSKRCAL